MMPVMMISLEQVAGGVRVVTGFKGEEPALDQVVTDKARVAAAIRMLPHFIARGGSSVDPVTLQIEIERLLAELELM